MSEDMENELVKTAYEKLEMGEIIGALEDFNEVLNNNPNDNQALFGKIQALKALGLNEELVQACDEYLKNYPQNAYVYQWRAQAEHELSEYNASVEDYKASLELNPQNPATYNDYGNVLTDLAEMDAAIECFDKAIELKPDYALAYNNRGVVKSYINLPLSDSIVDFKKAIELEPDLHLAINNLTEAFIDNGEYEKALKVLNDTESAYELFEYAYVNKGITNYFLGKKDEAVSCLQKGYYGIEDYLSLAKSNLSTLTTQSEKLVENNFLKEKLEAAKIRFDVIQNLYSEIEETTPRCDFCSSPVFTKEIVIGHKGVHICNECLEACNEILKDGENSYDYWNKIPDEKKRNSESIICSFCERCDEEVEKIITSEGEEHAICNGCVGTILNVIKNKTSFKEEYFNAVQKVDPNIVIVDEKDVQRRNICNYIWYGILAILALVSFVFKFLKLFNHLGI